MSSLCDGAVVVERDDTYFFDFVVFQVSKRCSCMPLVLTKYLLKAEKKLFNVPKNGFLDSNPSFFDKFAPINPPQVGNEAYPIELKNVTEEAFKGLLMVMYPL